MWDPRSQIPDPISYLRRFDTYQISRRKVCTRDDSNPIPIDHGDIHRLTSQRDFIAPFSAHCDKATMFKYVLIPCDISKEIVEKSASTDGGLENDALRRGAEEFFQEEETAIDHEAEQRATADALVTQGVEPQKISEIMSTIGGRRIGSNVEIITVAVANDANQFVGVSMYSDGHIAFKKNATINKRATKLLRSCGHDIDVKGDTFIGRAFDDEREEWRRLDFTTEDLNESSPWIGSTKAANIGRNMGAYRTSGAMQKMLQPNAATIEDTPTESSEPKGYLSWNQTSDEVEVRFALPADCTAKSITVTISSSSLRIVDKGNQIINEIGSQYQTAEGARYYGKIVKDDSMWSISVEDKMKILCVTLAKADSSNWQHFTLP